MKERRKSTFTNNCIHIIILSFICINTQAQTATNTSLFPILNLGNDKEIGVEDFTPENSKKNKGFLLDNPDYFQTGKYIWDELNYRDYPSLQVNSNNLLDKYSSIIVLYSGSVAIDEKNIGWYPCYFSSDFEVKNNLLNLLLGDFFVKDFNSLNEYYKSNIYTILKNKNANNIIVLDMMKNKIPFIDDFKNSLILQYKKDQLNIVRGINGRWPGYSKFSLTVLNFKGDVIHKYNQVLFFQCNTWHDLIIEKACTKQAFNSLLNQFLNDTKTKEVLEKLSSKQLNAVTDNTVAVNKLQIDLLNIKLEKNKIISNLQSLGVNMDGISSSTFVDTKSLTAYNPSYSSEINQVGSSIGTLAGGITNALYANSDRKAVEKIKLVGSKLKLRFRDLDDEEKSITATIPPEILNSPAVLFLPNNPDLNQYMEEASQSLEKKAATAKANVAEQYTRINNELNEQAAASKSKSQSTNSSVESSAITNGPDGNSPEAVRCGRDAINEAKGPNSYYMKFMKNQGCAKYSYQYKQQCIEITLRKCRQYLSQEEIDSYNRINATLIQQIAQMPDCKNFLQK